MGTTVDTVERRLQEEILRRDALMLANVKQSIVCTDLNGIVTYWNSGATELYGWTADEMIGRPFYSRMATEEMRAHARMRMKTAATVGEFRHEREDFRKDGTRIFVDSRVFAIRDPEGRITGVIGMASDITARRQAELDRLQLERQLLQAQKMETIGTLASGVAHEFNNILAVIIGNIELAEMIDPEDRTYREHHDIVLRCSRRARDLVQRMLSFSRAHDLERRPVQLALVVAEAAKLIRVTLPESVDLQLDPAPAVPDILIDVNQFQQLAMNLAANAGYAMREKGGRLVFRTRMAAFAVPHACAHVTLPAGSYVALDVSDEGQGIEAGNLAKIFNPFFTTKPVGEGSGLGLAIVHGIVAGHGGGVDVVSTPGAGTTFTLYFPVEPRGTPPARAGGDSGDIPYRAAE